MLHLKMVRSPLHHARIRGVDLAEAERVPGFVRALTAADVPHNGYTILGLIGVEPEEEFVLAEDRVRFKGEAIVAIVAETEEAALEAVSRVRLDLEELPAVFDVEEALKPGAPIVTHWGNNTFMYEGHPCRRVRLGDVEAAFARADHIVEGVYDTEPDRARPDRDDRLHRGARGERPVHRLHQHPGALLQPRQHLDHPAGPRQPAPLRRRDGRRRLRWQGRRHRRADRHAGGDEDEPAGALRLQPRGGDAGVVDPQRVADLHQGRRHGRRPHHRPQGDELRRLRRLQPPDAVRADQARRQRGRPVRDPERLDRRLLRLHEPPADQRDARLRHDDGLVRHRGPDGQDRRDRSASTRGRSGSSTPTTTAT